MISVEFQIEMERLSKRYTAKHYPPERIELLWSKVQYKPIQVLKEAVSKLIGENQTDPDNKTILEAVTAIERQKGMHLVKDEVEYRIQCSDCMDMGFMFITCDQGLAVWVYCHCNEGMNQFECRRLMIPRWDRAMAEVCTKRPIPVSFFKPRDGFSPEFPIESLMKTVLEWNKELRAAEMYWRSRFEVTQ